MKKIASLLMAALVLSPALASAAVDITLFGGSVTVTAGSTYNEPGYSAFSTVDGDVTGSVSTSNVDTSVAGTFSRTYSVTDSALDSAFASRTIFVVAGGGTMPFCSSPIAPGWNVSIPNGGCGGSERFVQFGQPLNAPGIAGSVGSATCQFPMGCMVKDGQ